VINAVAVFLRLDWVVFITEDQRGGLFDVVELNSLVSFAPYTQDGGRIPS